MKPSSLKEMNDLTNMLYRAEQARMRRVNEQESKLRRSLGSLEDHRKSLLLQPDEALGPMRSIGGDILWQGWVDRNQAEINRQLALCLAQKERMMERLCYAHGRHMATKSLLEKEIAIRKTRDSRQQLAQLDALIATRMKQTF